MFRESSSPRDVFCHETRHKFLHFPILTEDVANIGVETGTYGHFEGDCDWDASDQQQRACIPIYLGNNPNGAVSGTYNFVEDLLLF